MGTSTTEVPNWCGCLAILSDIYTIFYCQSFISMKAPKIMRSSCESRGRTAQFECSAESIFQFGLHFSPVLCWDSRLLPSCHACFWKVVQLLRFLNQPWNLDCHSMRRLRSSSCSNWGLWAWGSVWICLRKLVWSLRFSSDERSRCTLKSIASFLELQLWGRW